MISSSPSAFEICELSSCRSSSRGGAERGRARSFGRPQRQSLHAIFREGPHRSSVGRSGSRGGSVGAVARGRNVPSREVQLRPESIPLVTTSVSACKVAHVAESDACATKFVENLLSSSVANHVFEDIPMNYEFLDDQEPIAECDEPVEDDETQAANAAAELTGEALMTASQHVALMAEDVGDKSDMGIATIGQLSSEDDTMEEDRDQYEEILSTASHDSWEELAEDKCTDAQRYVQIAVKCAKESVEATEDDAALRVQARDALQQAELQGRLASALRQVKDKKPDIEAEALRVQTRTALFEAACDGRLRSALLQAKEAHTDAEQKEEKKLWSQARNALMQGAVDGRLASALQDAKQQVQMAKMADAELDDFRQQTRDSLLQGCQDGRLASALREARAIKQQTETETVRLQAKDLLIQASIDGRISSALRKVKEASMGATTIANLRLQARETLLQGASDGRLATALQIAAEQKEEQKLRAQARNALLQGAVDGRLASALHDAKQQAQRAKMADAELDNLRQQTRDSLLQGCQNGRLASALREAKEQKEMQKLRSQARKNLLQGAVDGRLSAALQDAKHQVQLTTMADAELDDLRQQTRDSLLQGCQDGRLASALREAKEQKEMQKLRSQARKTLLQGAVDGRLSAALQQTGQSVQEIETANAGIDELRRQTCDILLQSAQDGRLATIIRAAKEKKQRMDEDALRLQTRNLLLKASFDGRLSSALQEAKKERTNHTTSTEVVQMKQEVRNKFLQAAANGTLRDAFQQTKEDQRCKDGAQADEEAVRTNARKLFMDARMDGRLAAALDKQPTTGDVSELGSQARSVLMKASIDGRLATALHDEKQAHQLAVEAVNNRRLARLRRRANSAQETDPAKVLLFGDSTPLKADEVEQSEMKMLRSQACQMLMQGALDGRLDAALQEATSQEQPTEEIGRMREQMRDTLLQGALDGRLASAIREAKEREQRLDEDALRLRAMDMLLKASRNGKLSSALREVKESSVNCAGVADIDHLKQEVRDSLLQADANGALRNALQQAKDKTQNEDTTQLEVEAIRTEARALLTGSFSDGRFAAALAALKTRTTTDDVHEVHSQSDETEHIETTTLRSQALREAASQDQPVEDIGGMRRQMCETLLQGALDGRLRKAVDEAAERKRRVDEDALRLQARDLFLNARFDGPLVSASHEARALNVASQSNEDEVDELRSQTCNMLLKASMDGRAAAVLRELKQAKGEEDQDDDEEEDEKEMETLRVQVRETLLSANLDGRLSASLREASRDEAHSFFNETRTSRDTGNDDPDEKDNGENLKNHLNDILLKAQGDGRLHSALLSFKKPQEAELEVEAEVTEEVTDSNVECSETHACDFIMHVPDDGSTLEAVKEDDHINTIQVDDTLNANPLDALMSALNITEDDAEDESKKNKEDEEEVFVPKEAASFRPTPEPLNLSMVESAASLASPARNLVSSRSRRRIIGGVVRTPAGDAKAEQSPTSAAPRMNAVKSRMTPIALSRSATPTKRDSSLTRAYDSLGPVEFFSIATKDIADDFNRHVPPAPPLGALRPGTKAGMPRNHSDSALMLDLGSDSASHGSIWAPMTNRSPSSSSGRSSSLGALGASIVMTSQRSKLGGGQAGFLPSLSSSKARPRPSLHSSKMQPLGSVPFTPSSAGSVAWSVHGSRSRLASASVL